MSKDQVCIYLYFLNLKILFCPSGVLSISNIIAVVKENTTINELSVKDNKYNFSLTLNHTLSYQMINEWEIVDSIFSENGLYSEFQKNIKILNEALGKFHRTKNILKIMVVC